MCGIAGFINLRFSPTKQKVVIKQMTDVIAHRGPDGEGHFVSDGVAFGNRRLAIIDLSLGKQPMASADGRYWITFNGEIYNYLELKTELKKKGVLFQTDSDTEVLLASYIAYGPDCVRQLNGMFAFAIFDTKRKLLFAARDRFGVKPFYYYQGGEEFIFGSEIKSILAAKPTLARLNPGGLSEYLTFQLCLGDKTLFKQIKKLEPGHYLLYQKNQLRVVKYWDLTYTVNDDLSLETWEEKLRWLLHDSVRLRLRSDVPVGAYLSGGLDSSTITTIAAKHYRNTLQTFSGRFRRKGYDETAYAKLLARTLGVEYHEVTLGPADFIHSIEKLIYFMDEPAAGPGLFPQYFVSKLASKYLKVVLGGQGGDEIFGGYARYLILYLEASLKGAIFETQERKDARFVVVFPELFKNLPILKEYAPLIKYQFSEGLFEPLSNRYFRLIDRGNGIRKLINRDFLPPRDDLGKMAFNQIFEAHDFGPLFNRMTYFDMKTSLPALLQVEDRMSMAASLESRTPFLDYRIAELMSSMPAVYKYKDGEAKHILKRVVKGIIPEEIRKRKDKMGFPVPLSEWLSGPLKDFVSDILLGRKAKQRGLYNVTSVEKIIREERAFDRRIWGLLNLELWFRTFIDA